DEPGTTPPIQLLAASQEPPPGATVVFHWIVDITTRSSRPSSTGESPFGRLRIAVFRLRDGAKPFAVNRAGWFMVGPLLLRQGASRVARGRAVENGLDRDHRARYEWQGVRLRRRLLHGGRRRADSGETPEDGPYQSAGAYRPPCRDRSIRIGQPRSR